MDIHFNAYKVKYDSLNAFFKPIKNSHNIHTMNIFINLDDVFHSLHRPINNNEFQAIGSGAPIQLISNVFNLIGHYRQWAVRMGIHCNVYAIYTSAMRDFKNNIFVKEYRKKYIVYSDTANSNYYYINTTIKQSMGLMKIISNYIDGVYIIDSKYLEPSSIPLYISNTNSGDWNILISRDLFDLQYVYKERWSYISPRGDESRLVSINDVWRTISIKEGMTDIPSLPHDTPALFTLALSVVGDKWRNIPRIKRIGWRTLFNYLSDIKEKIIDAGGTASQNELQLALVNKLLGKSLSYDTLSNNLFATSIDISVSNMNTIDESMIKEQMIDIPDYQNLLELNNRKFAKYPINLSFLTDQFGKNPTAGDSFHFG